MRISDWSSDVCSSDLGRPESGGRSAAGVPSLSDSTGHRAEAKGLKSGSGPKAQDRRHLARPRLTLPGGRCYPSLAAPAPPSRGRSRREEIGRAPRRERVAPFVYNSWVALTIKKQQI